jgi:DNA-binding CsgD family transcriptional regulator
MKKEKSFGNCFEEYLEVCSSIIPKSEMLDLRMLAEEKNAVGVVSVPFGTCLIDYTRRNYPYMSIYIKDIDSYPREEYIKNGLDFHMGIWHPEDKIVFEEQIFRDIREFWRHIHPEEFPRYRFSFNHRYYRSDGSVSHLLQHSTYLEPEADIPILNLAFVTDIGEFKSDHILILTVSHLVSGFGYVKVFSKSYIQQQKSFLSARESEILRLSLEGLSSKMIAEKLFISVLTVKHHKQNMMEKTSTNNITGLINLSLKNGWI